MVVLYMYICTCVRVCGYIHKHSLHSESKYFKMSLELKRLFNIFPNHAWPFQFHLLVAGNGSRLTTSVSCIVSNTCDVSLVKIASHSTSFVSRQRHAELLPYCGKRKIIVCHHVR